MPLPETEQNTANSQTRAPKGELTLAQAFAEHKDVLASYLARKMLPPADIEDLLQETFMQAYKAQKGKVISSPKGYLFIIARNLLSRKFARQAKEKTDIISEAKFASIAQDAALADQHVHYRLKLDVLKEAIESLPPQCRKVFLLRKVSGLSQKQIARQLNISTSTVERHITIALSRLNTIMQSKGYNLAGRDIKKSTKPSLMTGPGGSSKAGS